MKDYHINIFFGEEDGGYIADIPDLGACSAFGKTPDKALKQVQLAKRLWLQAAKADRKPIPQATLPPCHLPDSFVSRIIHQEYRLSFRCVRDVKEVASAQG